MRQVILLLAAVALLLSAPPGFAQQAPAVQPPAAPTKAARQPPPSDTKALVGLPVYSSDDQKVGQVKSVDTGSDGTITLEAEIEGFLGLGTSSVRLTSDQFQHKGDRIVLSKTAGEVRGVPDESYKSFDRSRGSGSLGPP